MVIVDKHEILSEEEKRLRQDRDRTKYWKRWGSYLSERQWATCREDYSADGDAWSREFLIKCSTNLPDILQIFHMDRLDTELIDGAKTVSLVSQILMAVSTLLSRSGMSKMRF
jgi:hypothetical protein